MNARTLSIGHELVSGHTFDSNAAWLARQLTGLGVDCLGHCIVPDTLAAIRDALAAAAHDADIVIVTGGLGPTPDDVTRDALAKALGRPLQLHRPSLEQIEAFFVARQRPMHENNKQQATLPETADAIPNMQGTAPGIHARLGAADIYCLPGVPYEMKAMFERNVRPNLVGASAGREIRERVLRTFGMSESQLGHEIADLMERGRNPAVGTSAADLVISIRIVAGVSAPTELWRRRPADGATGETAAPRSGRGASQLADEADRLVDADALEIRRRLGRVVFGEGDDTLAIAVARLLVERGETVSTAESCTGGLIAKRLTDVPGSSAYMVQGVVTYADEAKTRLLEVPENLIADHGAVSPEVAKVMATNCRRLADTDYALAATGIAGPTGGTAEKPIGLVYIALATRSDTTVKELRLGEHLARHQTRDRAAKIALNLLRRALG